MKRLKENSVYAAVRANNGKEWLDVFTVSCLLGEDRRLSGVTDREIPGYAQANPVVRFAHCDLIEKVTS